MFRNISLHLTVLAGDSVSLYTMTMIEIDIIVMVTDMFLNH